jgi:hypothetical protein
MSTPPRSTRPLRVLCGGLIGLCLGSAQAAIYRCGNTYQDSPCPGARTVEAADARSPEQRAAALQSQRAERERADDLADERHARERQLRPATAPAGITVRQPDALDALPSDHPCSRKPGSKAASRPKCINGLPVYVAKPASPGR